MKNETRLIDPRARVEGARRLLAAAPVVAVALLWMFACSTRMFAQEPAWYAGPVSPLADAVWHEQADRVKALLAAGANPDAPAGKPSLTPWQIAVMIDQRPSLELFAPYAAKRPATDYTVTLFKAVLQRGDGKMVAEFLRAGAPLQFSPTEYSPLHLAAANGYVDVMRVLLESKAVVDQQDKFGDTPLMAAVRSGRVAAVQLLLERGANVTLEDAEGRSAMTWARRAGKESVIAVLHLAGAKMVPVPAHASVASLLSPREAAQRSVHLLQKGGATWNERAKCASCHTQGLLVPVVGMARRSGLDVDESLASAQHTRLFGMMASFEPAISAGLGGEREDSVRFGLGFLAQAASGGARLQLGLEGGMATPLDEAAAVALGRTQLDDGRWHTGVPRVPLHETDIQTTALMVRVLRQFGPDNEEFRMRVHGACAWLLSARPATSQDMAFRLLGLKWAGALDRHLTEAADSLVREQDATGGWAQLPGMNVDAYATGVALMALSEGGMPGTAAPYQRGVAYLLRTQEADGSWFVHKRAATFNPYFDSGFPHGEHQFSSFVGTGLAAMALMRASALPSGQNSGQW